MEKITDPISDNYFENQFFEECKLLKESEGISCKNGVQISQDLLECSVLGEWRSWVDMYQRTVSEGRFPFLWPFQQDGISFDFAEELDELDKNNKYFSLGCDPSGDWYVMTGETGPEVYLCDQYDYGVYDYWATPNHLLAWAVRVVLADEHKISPLEIKSRFDQRENRIDDKTLERIMEEL
ncbi:hypothetical protein [Fulvitalea axinellae]|uniref:hypothetical protein n=1 Tax=Fulvitalea axinellae TaxID=1182444 RepID=UPI0030CA5A8A